MQVEGHQIGCLQPMLATGARVSNAYPTFPLLWYSPAKVGLIPDVIEISHETLIKDFIGKGWGCV